MSRRPSLCMSNVGRYIVMVKDSWSGDYQNNFFSTQRCWLVQLPFGRSVRKVIDVERISVVAWTLPDTDIYPRGPTGWHVSGETDICCGWLVLLESGSTTKWWSYVCLNSCLTVRHTMLLFVDRSIVLGQLVEISIDIGGDLPMRPRHFLMYLQGYVITYQ